MYNRLELDRLLRFNYYSLYDKESLMGHDLRKIGTFSSWNDIQLIGYYIISAPCYGENSVLHWYDSMDFYFIVRREIRLIPLIKPMNGITSWTIMTMDDKVSIIGCRGYYNQIDWLSHSNILYFCRTRKYELGFSFKRTIGEWYRFHIRTGDIQTCIEKIQ